MSGRAAMMRIGNSMLNNFILKNGVPDGLTAQEVMQAAIGDNSEFPEWRPPRVLFNNDGSIDGDWLDFETNVQSFVKWKKAQEKKKTVKKTSPAKNLNAKLGEYTDANLILSKLDTIDNNMRLTDEHEKLQQALNTLTVAYEDAATNEEKERLFRAIEKIVKGSGQYQDIQFLEKIKPEERDDIIHKLKLSSEFSKNDKFSKLEAMNQQINIEKQIRIHKYATLIFEERKLLDRTPQLHQRAKNVNKTIEIYTVNNSYQSIAQIQSCLNRGINDTEHECNWIGIVNQFDNIFSKAKSQVASDGTKFNLQIWQNLILNSRIPLNLIKVFICNFSDYRRYLEGTRKQRN